MSPHVIDGRAFRAAARRWFGSKKSFAQERFDLVQQLGRLAIEWARIADGPRGRFEDSMDRDDWRNTRSLLAFAAHSALNLGSHYEAVERIAPLAAAALSPTPMEKAKRTNSLAAHLRKELAGAIAVDRRDVIQKAMACVRHITHTNDRYSIKEILRRDSSAQKAIEARWATFAKARKPLSPHDKAKSLIMAGLDAVDYRGDPFVGERKAHSRKSQKAQHRSSK